MNIKKTFRLIMFMPIALFGATIAGIFGNWLGNYGIWIYEGSSFVGWIFSGIGSGLIFVSLGINVAPNPTKTIKWVLLGILFALGTTSALGGILTLSDDGSYLCGLVMILIGFFYSRLSPEEIKKISF